MLYNYFTEELLNLQEVLVKKIEKIENITRVYIEMPVIEHTCPECGEKTKYIHNVINLRKFYNKKAETDL